MSVVFVVVITITIALIERWVMLLVLCVRLADDDSPQMVLATPVRRSTRRSCATLPAGLRDHDTVIESLKDIVPEVTSRLLFRDNHALSLEWKTDTQANVKSLVHAADSRWWENLVHVIIEHSFIHSFMHSLTFSLIQSYSLIHSFIHSLSHSFMHSLTYLYSHARSLIYLLIHSFTHSVIHSSIHSLTHLFSHAHSFIPSFIHSVIHLFIHPFIHSFTYSLIHLLIHALIHSCSHLFRGSLGTLTIIRWWKSYKLKQTDKKTWMKT